MKKFLKKITFAVFLIGCVLVCTSFFHHNSQASIKNFWGCSKYLRKKLYLSTSPGSPFVYLNARACFRLGNIKLFFDCLKGIAKLHAVIEPRGISSMHAHSTKIAEIVSQESFPGRFKKFRETIQNISTNLESGITPSKDLWRIALDVSEGSREDAIDFMMLFVQDSVSKGIVNRLDRLGVQNAKQIYEDLQETRNSIYAVIKKTREISNETKNFGLPNFEGSSYDEVYHFWDAAFISKELVKEGVDINLARYLAFLNGDTYEKFLYTAYLLSPVLLDMIVKNDFGMIKPSHPLNHIAYHIRGAYLGTTSSTEEIPSQSKTVKFIKKNFWNHYRAIVFGDWEKPFSKPENFNMVNKALSKIEQDKIFIAAILATAYIMF